MRGRFNLSSDLNAREGKVNAFVGLNFNQRRNLSTGLATLCVGGGMGIATIIERI